MATPIAGFVGNPSIGMQMGGISWGPAGTPIGSPGSIRSTSGQPYGMPTISASGAYDYSSGIDSNDPDVINYKKSLEGLANRTISGPGYDTNPIINQTREAIEAQYAGRIAQAKQRAAAMGFPGAMTDELRKLEQDKANAIAQAITKVQTDAGVRTSDLTENQASKSAQILEYLLGTYKKDQGKGQNQGFGAGFDALANAYAKQAASQRAKNLNPGIGTNPGNITLMGGVRGTPQNLAGADIGGRNEERYALNERLGLQMGTTGDLFARNSNRMGESNDLSNWASNQRSVPTMASFGRDAGRASSAQRGGITIKRDPFFGMPIGFNVAPVGGGNAGMPRLDPNYGKTNTSDTVRYMSDPRYGYAAGVTPGKKKTIVDVEGAKMYQNSDPYGYDAINYGPYSLGRNTIQNRAIGTAPTMTGANSMSRSYA